jgi:hypothetical protein
MLLDKPNAPICTIPSDIIVVFVVREPIEIMPEFPPFVNPLIAPAAAHSREFDVTFDVNTYPSVPITVGKVYPPFKPPETTPTAKPS